MVLLQATVEGRQGERTETLMALPGTRTLERCFQYLLESISSNISYPMIISRVPAPENFSIPRGMAWVAPVG